MAQLAQIDLNNDDNSIFDCDLNTLAAKYSTQTIKEQQLSLTLSDQNDPNEILSSSIDKLLDNFFSKTFELKPPALHSVQIQLLLVLVWTTLFNQNK